MARGALPLSGFGFRVIGLRVWDFSMTNYVRPSLAKVSELGV